MKEIGVFHLSDHVFYETQSPGERDHRLSCMIISVKKVRAQVKGITVFLTMSFKKLMSPNEGHDCFSAA